MNVEFLRSHILGETHYPPHAVDNLPAHIAHDLINLCIATPLKDDTKAQVAALRVAMGVRPYDPHVYLESRETLNTCKPGQKILIIRKYGGLGDIYVCSYVLNEVHERFPQNPITFATPKRYHELFQNVPWLNLVDYEIVHQAYRYVRGGIIQSEFAKQFDVVEDISTPCHVWESIFKAHDMTAQGLKWRNRVDMWCGAMGLSGIKDPKTCIRLSPEEIRAAGAKYIPRGKKKVVLVSPTSALDTKDYPFHWPLRDRLAKEGFATLLVGDPKKVNGCLSCGTTRELLGLIASAWLTISVDSAVFHGAGVMDRPCIGLFNINDGACYSQYYPHAIPLQLCHRPCIMRDAHECQRPGGLREDMTCYRMDSIDLIMEHVLDLAQRRAAS